MLFGLKQKSFADEFIEFVGFKSLEAEERGDKRRKGIHKVNDAKLLDASLCRRLNLKKQKALRDAMMHLKFHPIMMERCNAALLCLV